jgi:poly(hydroxyalkanoate) depolymerase family esterase
MNNLRHLMKTATRLTGAGKLQAATAAIQAFLHRQVATPAAPAATAADLDLAPGDVRQLDATVAEPHELPTPPGESRSPARFVSGVHTHAVGRRDYKLFIPPGAGREPLPLVVMLHGCTQNPDDFAAGTGMNEAALAQGFYVLYPAQSRRANPQGCWNWFKHSHQQRGRGEPALLASMTREVMAQHAIDPRRVYVAGLSAGGAMAAIVGAAYPELFAAVGVHSGLAAGAANDLSTALAAMRSGGPVGGAKAHGVPTIVFHGDADSAVHPVNGERVAAASAGSASTVEVHRHVAANGRRASTRHRHVHDGRVVAEHWVIHGSPHAWSGGREAGSYTDSRGPDATAEMLRFFFEHPRTHTVQ